MSIRSFSISINFIHFRLHIRLILGLSLPFENQMMLGCPGGEAGGEGREGGGEAQGGLAMQPFPQV